MRLLLAAVLVVASLVAVDAASLPPGPCERAKLGAAAKAARGIHTCRAKAVDRGTSVDGDCLAKVAGKLARTSARAELASACVATGEAPAVTAAIAAVASDLGALAGGGPSRCDALRLRAAGGRMQKALAAEAKHALAPERNGLGTALAKAARSFGAAFGRAASAGGCSPALTASAVAARVDAGATAVVDAVRGTLASLGAARGRRVGAAVRANVLATTPLYGATLLRHFDFLTAEYELMWGNVEPVRGALGLAPFDTILTFAEAHGLPVKGAPLVWHLVLPPWVNDTMTPAELQAAVDARIDTLVGTYAGRVATWDVVNEAVNDGGPGYRSSLFLQKLGPAYVKNAFVRARQADPQALLFYNDFLADGLNAKSDFVYAMIAALLADGAPIDGVGFQMHLGGGFGAAPTHASVVANLQRFADLGLRVRISEMDVQTNALAATDEGRAAAQRAVYRDMTRACLDVAACDAISFWGFTDGYTWIDDYLGVDDRPLPFDGAYRAKAAFFGVRNALAGF